MLGSHMNETTWGRLRLNEWIICPKTGQKEQVLRKESRPNGFVFVRTTHHDHLRPRHYVVKLADP